jgi:hypothetical protein
VIVASAIVLSRTLAPVQQLPEDAQAALATRQGLLEKLLAAYARNIAMIEIEYETGDAAAALAADVGEEMATRFDELRLLEAEHAELSRELEANDEVERLLRPG